MIVTAPLSRCAGDDWTLPPIALKSAGKATDLTGCEVYGIFYATASAPGVELRASAGLMTLADDLTSGVVSEIWVPRAMTQNASPQPPASDPDAVRVVVMLRDARGRTSAKFAIPFRVSLARRYG